MAKILFVLEPVATMAIAPVLVFPTVHPPITGLVLSLLVVLWLLRWLARGESWPVTSFNPALLLFALMLFIGIWVSPLPELTLPKATNLLLGLVGMRLLVFTIQSRQAFVWATLLFLGLGVLIALVGVLSVDWLDKVAALTAITNRIPRLIDLLPELRSASVHPNQLAGTLILYIPFALGLIFASLVTYKQRSSLNSFLFFSGVVFFTLYAGGVMLLTQSRSGWGGALAGCLTLAVLWGLSDKRAHIRLLAWMGLLSSLIFVISLINVVGWSTVETVLFDRGGGTAVESVVGDMTLAARIEIWSRALYAIQDFAFTGMGLGTFREVVHLLYPLFLLGPTYDIAHAHNIFLQTGLDLGFPGLIAYLALLGIGCFLCWQQARAGGPLTKAISLGILSGLIGLHVYGLTDALALGSKTAIVFWLSLGFIAVVEQVGVLDSATISPLNADRIQPLWSFKRVAAGLLFLLLVAAGSTLLLRSSHLWLPQTVGVSQPVIRLPVYESATTSEVYQQNPPANAGWQGPLEVATFTTTDSLSEVVHFYHQIFLTSEWVTALESGDAESWGGVYTQQNGHSVCLLNVFVVQTDVLGSIVCGDKVEPVVIPPLFEESD